MRRKAFSRVFQGYLRGRITELAGPETRATSEPLARWAQRRIRLDGKPFSFEGHAYLRAIYDDPAPHVVLVKAAQIGGTTWAILRSIHACSMGLNAIYFFPTRTDVLEFSKSRVGPLLADNPFLRKLMTDTDTAGLKRIGEAHLYLRGMKSTVGMKSVPADMIVFDELDEAPPEAKTLALERLAHSDYKRVVELSNPSLPGYGVDEAYEASDQRHWTVKCPGCGRWTAFDCAFPTKLGQEVRIIREREDGTCYRACPKCGEELDVETGEWVAEYPDRAIHGYRISQLLSPKVDPGEILREYRKTRFPERFYNLKIGLPWADTQHRLDRMTVLACCGQEGMVDRSEEVCSMGVDTGRELHIVVSRPVADGDDRRRIIYLGIHRDYAEIDGLMERFNVGTCVIDAMPEIHATRAFAQRHPGRVWLNYFLEHQRGEPKWDEDQSIVNENRTEALDLSRAAIREGRVVLPRRLPLVEKFATHLASDAKRLEEDEETGAQRYRYVRTGPDHFSLAFTYDCLAAMREGGAAVGFSGEELPPYHTRLATRLTEPGSRRLRLGLSGRQCMLWDLGLSGSFFDVLPDRENEGES